MNDANGTATESIAVKTPDDTASSTNVPAPKPKTLPWPERKKPTDNYAFALAFIGEAITHMARQGTPLTTSNLGTLEKMYGNYCWNTGLRGKQKQSIWRIIKAQVADVKSQIQKAGKVAEEL